MDDPAWRDLASRWKRARRAALARILGPDADLGNEHRAARAAVEMNESEACRVVFENGLKLGTSFRRHFNLQLGLHDVITALLHTGAPCLAGHWSPVTTEPAFTLQRAPCHADASAHACDWWREAIDGLVLGLTGSCRHARHASRGHGGGRCVDVVFAYAESGLRFGTIPDGMRAGLDGVARSLRLFNSRVAVNFLGVSEGVLLYEVTGAGEGSGLSVTHMVENQVMRRFPGVRLQERTMRPVMDEPRGEAHVPQAR